MAARRAGGRLRGARRQLKWLNSSVNLTAEDLKDLDVGIVGHRRKLLDAIAVLRTGADAKAPTPSSTPLPTAPVAAWEKNKSGCSRQRCAGCQDEAQCMVTISYAACERCGDQPNRRGER
jgi:hypothetical protein